MRSSHAEMPLRGTSSAMSRRTGRGRSKVSLGDIAAFALGGFLRRSYPVLVAAVVSVLVAQQRFTEAAASPLALTLGATGALALVLGLQLLKRLSLIRNGDDEDTPSARAAIASELSLGFPALAAAWLFLQVTGGLGSEAWPLLYFVVAALCTFARRASTILLTGYTLGMLPLVAGTDDLVGLGVRALAIVAFAALARVLLHGLATWLHKDHDSRVSRAKNELLEQARYYRLAGRSLADSSARYADGDRDERRLLGSAAAVSDSVASVLSMVRAAVPCHSLVVMLTDPAGEKIAVRDALSDSEALCRRPRNAREGAPGVVVKQKTPLKVDRVPDGFPPLTYYEAPVPRIRVFLGLPILEGEHLRGVLCADRVGEEAEPFTEVQTQILATAASEVLRACEVERVLADLDREKSEKEKFYLASKELNQALTLSDVLDTALSATRQFIPYDFAAITLYDPENDRHEVLETAGKAADGIEFKGTTFRDNGSLVAAAVKTRHPMPYVTYGSIEKRRQIIFTPETKVPGLQTLQVYPLMVKGEPTGTFVVGAERSDGFDHDEWNMLQVIANQVAVAMENAKMYGRMERLATTDGLTGLNNHRRFQEQLEGALKRCDRHNRTLALILTDIDHFKSVNDTWGHPVGDMVLQRVSSVLQSQARATDTVARYGGEEFAIIMEETDAEGAKAVAERIRNAVAQQVFHTDNQKFQVTLSLGVAEYPGDASSQQQLIENSDSALYEAKHGGRNQSRLYAEK